MLLHPDAFLVLAIAMVLDAVIGDPDRLWRRYPHPVVWIGSLIGLLDRRLNHDRDSFARRRVSGILALCLVLSSCGLAGLALDHLLRMLPFHPWSSGLIASILIAQNSLHAHVRRVADALSAGGIAEARRAIAMIVGRNPDTLDEAGICRAAIETSAENFSDGVVAPVFWFALLGLPGIILYKGVNTADSMLGHRSARHEAFGWAAARLDDLVNLVPARLSGLLLALAAPLAEGGICRALGVMTRDARLHDSPNAGWPESAMAGALGVAIAGPRQYGARLVDAPFINARGRRNAVPADVFRALRLLWGGWALVLVLVVLAAGSSAA